MWRHNPLTRIASLTFFMQSLDTTMLYLALPAMALSLQESAINMEAVIVLYMLAVVAITPISGWLAERWGTRRIYGLAIVLFLGGSFCCALAPSLWWLGVFRTIQGIGGALMLPVVRVVILKNSLQSQQLSRLNTMTLLGLIGTFIGPILGGVIVDYLSWRYIFVVNLPVGLLCLVLNSKYMPVKFDCTSQLDIQGCLLLTSALCLFVLGLTSINNPQLPAIVIMLFFGIAGILMYAYRRHLAYQHFSPLSLFKLRTFSISIMSNSAIRMCLASVPLILSMMLQLELGYSPTDVSLLMLAMAMGSIVARLFQCRILRRLGYRNLLLTCTLLAVLLISPFIHMTILSSFIVSLGVMLILGMITSILYATMNTLTFSDLTDETYSTGNSILIISQLISITFSMTLSFSVIRLLSQTAIFDELDCYRGVFILLSLGLALSCFIFAGLKRDDGKQLLSESN